MRTLDVVGRFLSSVALLATTGLCAATALGACAPTSGAEGGAGSRGEASAALLVSAEERLRQVPVMSAMLDAARSTPPRVIPEGFRLTSTSRDEASMVGKDPRWSFPTEEVSVDVAASSGNLTISSPRGRFTARHLGGPARDVRLESSLVSTRDDRGELRSILVTRGHAIEELLARRDEASTGYELELPIGWTTRQSEADETVVEIRDERGRPRFRMVADFAWDATGTRWPVRTRVNGRQLTFAVADEAEGPVLIDPAWSSTSTPAQVRARASATVLPSGKVLLVGGHGDAGGASGGVLCTTEIYDPLDQTWQMGPPLRDADDASCTQLMDHTATPLADGTILIAGGANEEVLAGVAQQPAAVSTAWIYDPAAGTFERTGSMVEARVHHTATLLASGKVLIVGGSDRQSPLLEGFADCPSTPDGSETCERCIGKASGELYDPATRSFSIVPMPQPRACHTATRLSDDSVLLIGGGGEKTSVLGKSWGKALTDLTVFKMVGSSPTFTKLDMKLNTARFGHVAVLNHDAASPDADEILVAFGRDERAILPGISPQPNPQLAEIIDVKAAIAGTSSTAVALDVPVCCDKASPMCTSPDPCVTRRSYTAGTPLPRSAQALIVGGQEHDAAGNANRDATPSDKADVFDFASRTFVESTLSPVLKPALVTLPSGKTLLLGQAVPPALFDDEIWAFAPPTTGMAQPRYWHSVTQLSDGTLLVAGGLTPFATKGAEIYEPNATPPTTSLLASRMTACRQGHTATLLPASACVEDATCCSNSCVAGRCVGVESDPACTLGHGERVLLTGGAGLGSGPMDGGLTDCNIDGPVQPLGVAQDTADIYDVATRTFRATRGSMHVARAYHSATRLSSGQVLVVGGVAHNDPDLPNDPALRSVELFDPVSETFTEIGSLATGRVLQSATPLPSGDVLIAGGIDAFGYGNATTELSSAEIFDRSTQTFRPIPNLVIARGYHTSTALPNGNVLLTGGSIVSPSAEIFDVSTETFRLTAGLMHSIRIDARALMVPSGKVVIVGGDGANTLDAGPPFADAEIFDVSTETFETIACPGCTGRVDHVMALLPNGAVGLFGGSTTTGDTPVATNEVATIAPQNDASDALPRLDFIASSVVAPGVPHAIGGSRLTSFWESSTGPYVSPTNMPTAVWVPFQGAPVVGSLVEWSDTAADWIPRSSAFAGPGLLFAARNGQLSANALPVAVGLAPNGVGCDADTACESGFCSDGVCCNERCHDPSDPDAICRACSVALGADLDGVCAAATPGTDPHQDCAALPQCAADSATCGPKGECKPCTCNAESDCADGYTCTAQGICARPAEDTDPQGCSTSSGSTPGWPAAIILGALVIDSRRRRSRTERGAAHLS